MARNYKQGKFKPKHPEKYVGDPNNIVYRSSWEKKVFHWLDMNPAVSAWNSEGIAIPYLYPVDGKMHRYFVDLVATINGKNYLIEIKPKHQTQPPKPPKRKTQKAMQTFNESLLTWEKNKAKWMAAKEWAKENGMEFMILTEDHIFGK